MDFTTNMTIVSFVSIFLIFGIGVFVSIKKAIPPRKKMVDRYYSHKILEDDKYFFFYQKAVAYRKLFEIHTTVKTVFKVLGTTSTFITVYCAVDKNSFVLLFALIAATSEALSLAIPFDLYAKIYVQAARLLENELNASDAQEDTDKILERLNEAYMKAEKLIENDFI